MKFPQFTLKQLLLIVFCISLLLTILTPSLWRARISANEGSAIGTMQACITGEAKFGPQSCIDQDTDGTGEYGTLGELAGYSICRHSGGVGKKCNPTFVPGKLAPIYGAGLQGVGSKSGYYFRIYLPNSSGGKVIYGHPVAGSTCAAPTVGMCGADLQEEKWVGYAWPVSHRTTGFRCFCTSQEGETYGAPNVTSGGFTTPYSGTLAPPYYAMLNAANKPDAAMQAQLWFGRSCGTNEAGDKQIWAG